MDSPPAEQHLADGYASEDDCRPRRPARGFGALPGDCEPRRRLSQEEVLEYGIRQASSGPSTSKFHFLDAFRAASQRPSLAQTKPRTAIQRHHALLQKLRCSGGPETMKTDLDMLRESHRFLRTEDDDDGSWEARLAKRYYDRLFREYVLCDLAGYRKGKVGFRWRTESEVVQGKGQFHCGHKPCESRLGLRSYEVDFQYCEAGSRKRALVKVRLCELCAYKLHYRSLRARRKRQRREAKRERKRAKKSDSPARLDVDSCSESAASETPDKDSKSSVAGTDRHDLNDAVQPSEEDRRLLESLAWRGPDPKAQTRQDDFDEYLQELFM